MGGDASPSQSLNYLTKGPNNTFKNLNQNNKAGYYVKDIEQLITIVHSLLSEGDNILLKEMEVGLLQ